VVAAALFNTRGRFRVLLQGNPGTWRVEIPATPLLREMRSESLQAESVGADH
jgi:hypothetical protein